MLFILKSQELYGHRNLFEGKNVIRKHRLDFSMDHEQFLETFVKSDNLNFSSLVQPIASLLPNMMMIEVIHAAIEISKFDPDQPILLEACIRIANFLNQEKTPILLMLLKAGIHFNLPFLNIIKIFLQKASENIDLSNLDDLLIKILKDPPLVFGQNSLAIFRYAIESGLGQKLLSNPQHISAVLDLIHQLSSFSRELLNIVINQYPHIQQGQNFRPQRLLFIRNMPEGVGYFREYLNAEEKEFKLDNTEISVGEMLLHNCNQKPLHYHLASHLNFQTNFSEFKLLYQTHPNLFLQEDQHQRNFFMYAAAVHYYPMLSLYRPNSSNNNPFETMDIDGNTVLHHALRSFTRTKNGINFITTVIKLLKFDFDRNRQNRQNQSPLDCFLFEKQHLSSTLDFIIVARKLLKDPKIIVKIKQYKQLFELPSGTADNLVLYALKFKKPTDLIDLNNIFNTAVNKNLYKTAQHLLTNHQGITNSLLRDQSQLERAVRNAQIEMIKVLLPFTRQDSIFELLTQFYKSKEHANFLTLLECFPIPMQYEFLLFESRQSYQDAKYSPNLKNYAGFFRSDDPKLKKMKLFLKHTECEIPQELLKISRNELNVFCFLLLHPRTAPLSDQFKAELRHYPLLANKIKCKSYIELGEKALMQNRFEEAQSYFKEAYEIDLSLMTDYYQNVVDREFMDFQNKFTPVQFAFFEKIFNDFSCETDLQYLYPNG